MDYITRNLSETDINALHEIYNRKLTGVLPQHVLVGRTLSFEEIISGTANPRYPFES